MEYISRDYAMLLIMIAARQGEDAAIADAIEAGVLNMEDYEGSPIWESADQQYQDEYS